MQRRRHRDFQGCSQLKYSTDTPAAIPLLQSGQAYLCIVTFSVRGSCRCLQTVPLLRKANGGLPAGIITEFAHTSVRRDSTAPAGQPKTTELEKQCRETYTHTDRHTDRQTGPSWSDSDFGFADKGSVRQHNGPSGDALRPSLSREVSKKVITWV